MTRIEATIAPSRLDDLRRVLSGHPWISGLTVLEVKAFDGFPHDALYRGAEYAIEFAPEVKVELVVPAPLVPRIVDEIERWARSGRIGNGRIVVCPVDDAVRVRTGERGEGAL